MRVVAKSLRDDLFSRRARAHHPMQVKISGGVPYAS
jgi:hypothetical protein